MDVAAHLLGEIVEPADQRIGAVVHQLGLRAQADEQRVEQREPLRVAVQRRRCGRGRGTRAAPTSGAVPGIGGGALALAEQVGAVARRPARRSGRAARRPPPAPRAASRQASKSSGGGQGVTRRASARRHFCCSSSADGGSAFGALQFLRLALLEQFAEPLLVGAPTAPSRRRGTSLPLPRRYGVRSGGASP